MQPRLSPECRGEGDAGLGSSVVSLAHRGGACFICRTLSFSRSRLITPSGETISIPISFAAISSGAFFADRLRLQLSTPWLYANAVPICMAKRFSLPNRVATPLIGCCNPPTPILSTEREISLAFRTALAAKTKAIVIIKRLFNRQQSAEHPGGSEALFAQERPPSCLSNKQACCQTKVLENTALLMHQVCNLYTAMELFARFASFMAQNLHVTPP